MTTATKAVLTVKYTDGQFTTHILADTNAALGWIEDYFRRNGWIAPIRKTACGTASPVVRRIPGTCCKGIYVAVAVMEG